jgi:hypothetical protein
VLGTLGKIWDVEFSQTADASLRLGG